jgi:hypothetical protein
MKKSAFLRFGLAAVGLVGLLFFTGCMGNPGPVYLEYTWVYAPLSFYDENPSTPSVVTNGAYFTTAAGSFNMDYTAWDGSYWAVTYTLTSYPGQMNMVNGGEADFSISLTSTGPELTQTRNILPAEGSKSTLIAPGPQAQTIMQAKGPELTSNAGSPAVNLSVTSNGYKLDISARKLN